MLLESFKDVPVQKTFTFDWYANGPLSAEKPLASKVLMHYKLLNDEKHAMGKFPLQPGKVRIFIEDGHGGEAFLGEDWAKLTPLDGDMKLYLGEARDVVCTRTLKDTKRHPVRGNLFNQEVSCSTRSRTSRTSPPRWTSSSRSTPWPASIGADPHGDAEWEVRDDTSKEIQITREDGGATPRLHVSLPARPADPNVKVATQTFVFHLLIKNLW